MVNFAVVWSSLAAAAVFSSAAVQSSISHGQRQLGADLLNTRPVQRQLQQVQNICSEPYTRIPFNWRSKQRVLALTFDDGPDADGLTPILDLLKKHGIPATFFFNSINLRTGAAQVHKDAAKRAFREGHEIGSHGAEHLDYTKLEKQQIDEQLLWNIGNISTVTGSLTVPLFRAPYGAGYWTSEKEADDVTRYLWNEVQKYHVHVMWSWDGKDWALRGDSSKCASMYDAYGPELVKQNATGVVLMHAYNGAMGMCADVLEKLLTFWKHQNYKFVKVSQLVQERYGMPPTEVVKEVQHCPV